MDTVPQGPEDARALLAALVNSSQDAIVSKTLDGVITSWNRAAETLFGYTAAEAIGRHIGFIIPPEDQAEEEHILREVRAGRRVELREVTRVARDGRRLQISLVVSPIRDAAGNVVGASKVARDITAKRQAEATVEASNRLVRLIVDNVPALISYVDRDLRYRLHNKAYESMFRRRAEEIDGQHVRDLLGPEMFARLQPHMEAALAGQTVTFEQDFPYPAGSRRSEVTYVPQIDGAGSVAGFAVLITDIEERHRVEAQLKRSDEEQRFLVSLHDATRGLTDPIEVLWRIVNLVGRHFRVSRCTLAEIEPNQEYAQVSRDYVDGVGSSAGRHRLDEFGAALVADMKAGRTVVVTDIHADPRTQGPTQRPGYEALRIRSVLGAPLLRNGLLVSVLVLHDHVPRSWSEHEVRLFEQVAERTWFALDSARATAALRESQEVLSLAMRGGRMGVWWSRLDENRVWWSAELAELFGLAPGSFEGTEAAFYDRVHPEDRAAMDESVGAAVTAHTDYTVAFRFRHASGEWRWMDGRGRAAYDPQGRPTMLYGIGIDITDSRRAIDALREADRRKSEFLAVLAHELRNPLAPIRNAVQYMKLKAMPDADLQAAQQIIERQAIHLARLVDDLMDVSRISSGRIELQKQRISLSMVLTNAVEAARPAIADQHHELVLETPEQPVYLDADSIRLSQVVQNLLNNAAKYTPPGGRLTVRAEVDGHILRLQVKDNGIGIPAEMLTEIFEMFTQVDRSLERTAGGLGIGLTLVRRLVELHGGTVQARSEGLGRGSSFVVELPVVIPGSASTTPGAEPPVRARAVASILVVDDNLDSAETMCMTLQFLGHEVRTAHDGLAAIAAVQERMPDIVLLDIGLPKLNGLEVARQIRVLPGGRDALLIAITGWGQEADRQQSQDAGFDHHLVKPVDLGTLTRLLDDPRPRTPHPQTA